MSGRILIATQGWNYAAWVVSFYPEGTRTTDFLGTYAQAFATAEVDSTFYAIPPASTVRGWAARTPADFVFSLKLPQEITHERGLRDSDELVREFTEVVRELGPRLGPILVQLGPPFGPDKSPALERFLPRLPSDLRFALEVRNPRWMRAEVRPRLLSLLAEHGIALALSDGPWVPRDTMQELAERPTAGFHYLRWMGPNRDITDYSHVQYDRGDELRSWADVLRRAVLQGTEVYGYFNNHFAGHSPASARE